MRIGKKFYTALVGEYKNFYNQKKKKKKVICIFSSSVHTFLLIQPDLSQIFH